MLASRLRRALPLTPVIVSLAVVLTACERGGGSAPAFTARDTVYIGVASTRQPDAVSYGYGVRLAVEHLNAQRPAGAPPFGVRLAPVEQPSQVLVAAYFRDDPAVIGVVGHTGSGQTMEAAPVYGDVDHGGEHAIVAITPTATNPAVTRASPWVFRVCPTDNDAARALARYASDSLKARRIALVFRNDLFGRGFTRTFVPELEGRGARIIERDPYLANVIEWDAYAERLARRGADAVVLAGGAPDAANFIRALRKAGFNAMFLGTDDVARLGVDTASRREFAGVRFTAFYRPPRTGTATSTTPAQRFVSEYRERYKESPDHQAALSYDAAMLIGRAALSVGPDRMKVRDWISAVGRTAPSYDGITGEISFDEWGDAVNKPVVIDQVQP